jgi:hypothetical protein
LTATLRFAQRSGYKNSVNRGVARFADGEYGSQDRTAVLVAGDAHNFLCRNKRLASLRKKDRDSLRNDS